MTIFTQAFLSTSRYFCRLFCFPNSFCSPEHLLWKKDTFYDPMLSMEMPRAMYMIGRLYKWVPCACMLHVCKNIKNMWLTKKKKRKRERKRWNMYNKCTISVNVWWCIPVCTFVWTRSKDCWSSFTIRWSMSPSNIMDYFGFWTWPLTSCAP